MLVPRKSLNNPFRSMLAGDQVATILLKFIYHNSFHFYSVVSRIDDFFSNEAIDSKAWQIPKEASLSKVWRFMDTDTDPSISG